MSCKFDPTKTYRFTPRQLTVLKFRANGHTLKETAHELKISRKTVEKHWENVRGITQWPTTVHATHYCLRKRLVLPIA